MQYSKSDMPSKRFLFQSWHLLRIPFLFLMSAYCARQAFPPWQNSINIWLRWSLQNTDVRYSGARVHKLANIHLWLKRAVVHGLIMATDSSRRISARYTGYDHSSTPIKPTAARRRNSSGCHSQTARRRKWLLHPRNWSLYLASPLPLNTSKRNILERLS